MPKHKHIWRLINGQGPKRIGDQYIQQCKTCNITRKHEKRKPDTEGSDATA